LLRSRCDLLSFPTRRSSDLLFDFRIRQVAGIDFFQFVMVKTQCSNCIKQSDKSLVLLSVYFGQFYAFEFNLLAKNRSTEEIRVRSEEHTSELQSRENLVCRL